MEDGKRRCDIEPRKDELPEFHFPAGQTHLKRLRFLTTVLIRILMRLPCTFSAGEWGLV